MTCVIIFPQKGELNAKIVKFMKWLSCKTRHCSCDSCKTIIVWKFARHLLELCQIEMSYRKFHLKRKIHSLYSFHIHSQGLESRADQFCIGDKLDFASVFIFSLTTVIDLRRESSSRLFSEIFLSGCDWYYGGDRLTKFSFFEVIIYVLLTNTFRLPMFLKREYILSCSAVPLCQKFCRRKYFLKSQSKSHEKKKLSLANFRKKKCIL